MKYRHLYRWDLDKTYLETDFDSTWALVKTFFQRPADKENVPGSDILIRALRRDSSGSAGIFFLSGSPKQMRRVLQEKLRLDGVYCEQIELKDNLRNILRGRFRAIKEQIGFKLPALLTARSRVSTDTTETLFGDDAERDAFVYSLYADLVAGKVGPGTLERVLKMAQIFPDSRAIIYDGLDSIENAPRVERIFIHLNRLSPPIQFEDYGQRLVPIYNYLQASIILLLDERLNLASVWDIAKHFSTKHAYTKTAHIRSLRDLLRRRLINISTLHSLQDKKMTKIDPEFNSALSHIVGSHYRDAPIKKNKPNFEIDYVRLLQRDIMRRQRKGPRGLA